MDKLSSILPNSPRVQSVDLSDAQPRRPGSPTYGAPVGTTASMRDRRTIGSKPSLDEAPVYQNPKEAKSAKLINDVTKSFFEKRLTPQEASPGLASQMAMDEMADAMVTRSNVPMPSPLMRGGPGPMEPGSTTMAPGAVVGPSSPASLGTAMSAGPAAGTASSPALAPNDATLTGRHIDMMA